MTTGRFQVRLGRITEHDHVTWDADAEALAITVRTLAEAGETGALMANMQHPRWQWIDSRTLIGRTGRRLVRAEDTAP